MRLLLASALVALHAAPALAQSRGADLHQTLIELSFVLGESHALRQTCSGANDQFWRGRMIRMVEAERPEPDLDRAIKEAFNAGFTARRAEFQRCGAGVTRAQAATATRGRALSEQLARAKVIVSRTPDEAYSPETMAEPRRPR